MKHIPDAIEKRDLLHGRKKLASPQKSQLAKLLDEEGWTSDALDFLTDDKSGIAALKAKVVAEGNVFLLFKIFRILGEENSDDTLRASINAENLGKIRYAIKGFEKLERTEKVESLKAQIADDGDQKTALNDVFIPKSEEEREEEFEEES